MLSIITSVILILSSILVLFVNQRRIGVTVVGVSLLSNIISIILYYLSPTLSRVNIVIATREVTIYLLVILAFISIKRLSFPIGHLVDKIYLFVFLLLLAMIAMSIPQYGLSALLMGRELIFPFATYFFFRFINIRERHVKPIIRFIIALAVFTAILGIVEFIYVNFVNPDFWAQVKISGYLAQKYGAFDEPYPLSWVNYLNKFIGLPPGLRIIGLMLDPLATGHFLACSFATVFYWMRNRIKYLLLFVIGLSILFTFSKACLLICFVTIATQIFFVRNRLLRTIGIGLFFVAVAAIGSLLLSTGDDNFTHFGSFQTGIQAIIQNPLGHKIGSTGYFTILTTGQGSLEAIDTTFSVYVYQMGIIGLFALVGIVFVPLLTLLRQVRNNRRTPTYKPLLSICLALFTAYSILAFSSAAAFTAVPIFIPMMLLAIYHSLLVYQKRMNRLAQSSFLNEQFVQAPAL